jgi:hypothetical protein
MVVALIDLVDALLDRLLCDVDGLLQLARLGHVDAANPVTADDIPKGLVE